VNDPRAIPEPTSCVRHLVLDEERIKDIRAALLVGLHSYGEIDRLLSLQLAHELAGDPVPEELRASHPTGGSAIVCVFAAALTALESESPEKLILEVSPDDRAILADMAARNRRTLGQELWAIVEERIAAEKREASGATP
jgi:hypothetical protein